MKVVNMGVAALLMLGLAVAAQAGSGCGSEKKSSCTRGKSDCGREDKTQAHGEHGYGTIDTAGLKSLMAAGHPLTVVDARSAEWDDGKRLPGAIALTADQSDAEIQSAIPSKDSLVVAYCSNQKCQASAKLADRLVALGYANVIKYPDGIAGWVEAGQAVEQKMVQNAE